MSGTNPCGLYAAPTPPGRHVFCGPSAIAAITGHTPLEVEQAVVRYREKCPPPRKSRRGEVSSMWSSEIAGVAAMLGYNAECMLEAYRGGATFACWRRHTLRRDPKGAYLVLITGHFVAVQGDWFVDSANRQPILARRYSGQRKRLRVVWRFTKAAP